jgi:hypothetical protein
MRDSFKDQISKYIYKLIKESHHLILDDAVVDDDVIL